MNASWLFVLGGVAGVGAGAGLLAGLIGLGGGSSKPTQARNLLGFNWGGSMPTASQQVTHVIAGPRMASYRGRVILDRLTTNNSIKVFTLFPLQLGGLCALNFAGVWAVEATRLPIPGNLVGMVGLYLLLSLGIVKVSWFDATGSFLIKHLAFFFIPITVGLMDSGGLLAAHGVGIAVILVASATIGILLAGLVSQFLISKPSGSGGGQ